MSDFTAAAGETAADTDTLILVDEADRGVGHLSKVLCHEGRAFCTGRSRCSFSTAAASCCCSSARRRNGFGRCSGRTAAAAIRAAPRPWRPRFSAACTKSWVCAVRCVPVQISIPGAIRRYGRGERALLGVHRALHRFCQNQPVNPVVAMGQPRGAGRGNVGRRRGNFTPGSCSNGPGYGGITAPKCWICNLKLGSAASRGKIAHGHSTASNVQVARYIAGRN